MRTKTQHFPVLLIGICIAAVLFVCLNLQLQETLFSQLTFRDMVSGRSITPVYDEKEDKYYLFLPSYLSPADVEVKISGGGYTTIASEEQSFDSDLDHVPLGEDLTVTVVTLFHQQTETLQIWQCGKIPTLHIDAQNGMLDYIHESRSNKSDVGATFYDENGEVMLEEQAKLYGRGHSSWWMGEKRPYNLKFSEPVSVGPFENVAKLNLFAEFSDRSKLRNATAYSMANQLQIPYSSDYMHFDLFVNGEYLGIYGAVTKENYVKFLEESEIKSVFTITSGSEHIDFYPQMWNNPVQILYGDHDEIWETVYRLEKALQEKDWDSCWKYLDVTTFAKKYVMEELLANSDAGYASQYFYIDQRNVIHCMLPWDYDLTLGNTFSYYNNKTNYEIKAYLNEPNWYSALLESELFRRACLQVLENEVSESLMPFVKLQMEKMKDRIQSSWYCDAVRWDSRRLPGDDSVANLGIDDYPEVFSALLEERIAFLSSFFENWEEICVVSFSGDWQSNFCIPRGENLWQYLDGANILLGEKMNSNFQGWYTGDGRTPQDIGQVTEDIVFYARGEESP